MTPRFPLGRVLAAAMVAVTGSALVASPAEASTAREIERVAGSDRFTTAAELSRRSFPPGTSTVFVANGDDAADALPGGAAAAFHGAPLLLVDQDRVPEATAAELERLDPTSIVILGGVAAVGDSVRSALERFTAGTISRLAGSDRISTATTIATTVWPDRAPIVLVAAAGRASDALAGAAASGHLSAPILLVRHDAVPDQTARTLEQLGPSRIVVLGGTAAVSDAVRDRLRTWAPDVTRIAGANRVGTAAQVAEDTFGTVDTVYLAGGSQPFDALAAGPAAARVGAPVLLTRTDCLSPTTARTIADLDPARVVIVGGAGSVSEPAAALQPCAPIGSPRSFVVVHVRPADAPAVDRDQAIRSEVGAMNDWFVTETGRRIRLVRSGETVVVRHVRLTVPTDQVDYPAIRRHLLDVGMLTTRQSVLAFAETGGDSCGRGGTGLAVLWIDRCLRPPGSPRDGEILSTYAGIGAHEVLHALGAVPTCAPNEDGAHITADADDIMQPVYDPSRSYRLDPGRDDYYGHGRLGCLDAARVRYWERPV